MAPLLSSTMARSMVPNSQQWPPWPYINGPCPYTFACCHYVILEDTVYNGGHCVGERVAHGRSSSRCTDATAHACVRVRGHAHGRSGFRFVLGSRTARTCTDRCRCDSISWMTNRTSNVVRRRLKGAAPGDLMALVISISPGIDRFMNNIIAGAEFQGAVPLSSCLHTVVPPFLFFGDFRR